MKECRTYMIPAFGIGQPEVIGGIVKLLSELGYVTVCERPRRASSCECLRGRIIRQARPAGERAEGLDVVVLWVIAIDDIDWGPASVVAQLCARPEP